MLIEERQGKARGGKERKKKGREERERKGKIFGSENYFNQEHYFLIHSVEFSCKHRIMEWFTLEGTLNVI